MRAPRVGLLTVGLASVAANFTQTCLGLRREACLVNNGTAWSGGQCTVLLPQVWNTQGPRESSDQVPLYKYRYLSPQVMAAAQQYANMRVVMIGDSTVRNQFMHLALHLMPNCSMMTLASCVLLKRQEKMGFWRSSPSIKGRVHDQDHGFWGAISIMSASSPSGFNAIYVRSHSCRNQFVIANLKRSRYLQRDPDVILYNVGAHNLHVFPAPRVSPAPSEVKCLLNVEGFFKESIADFKSSCADCIIMWRTSTSFCESNWGGLRKHLIDSYRCISDNATEQEMVYAACSRGLQLSALDCARSLLAREAVMLHREQAVMFLREHFSEVGIVDAFTLTEGTCHLSEPGDAIHRVRLLNHINLAFFRELQRLTAARSNSSPKPAALRQI